MSAIKDLVDLVKELESRAKDRQDLEQLREMSRLVVSVPNDQVEIMQRDIELLKENHGLRDRLEEKTQEEVVIYEAIEFHRGPRTMNIWTAFCPKCGLSAVELDRQNGQRWHSCAAKDCDWRVWLPYGVEVYRKKLPK